MRPEDTEIIKQLTMSICKEHIIKKKTNKENIDKYDLDYCEGEHK